MPRQNTLARFLDEIAAINAVQAARRKKGNTAPHVATEQRDQELCRHLMPHLQHRVLHPEQHRRTVDG
jgi:hypothetical protein